MSPHGSGRLRAGRDPTSTRVTAAVVKSGRVRLARPAPSEGGSKGGGGVVPGQRVAMDPSQVQATRHVRRSAEAVTAAASCRCVRTYTIKTAEAKGVRGRATMPPRATSPPRAPQA